MTDSRAAIGAGSLSWPSLRLDRAGGAGGGWRWARSEVGKAIPQHKPRRARALRCRSRDIPAGNQYLRGLCFPAPLPSTKRQDRN
jgi:hypothetical protein